MRRKQNKKFLIGAFSIIAIALATFLIAQPNFNGHDSDHILVQIGTSTTSTMTLQEAITNGYLMEGYTATPSGTDPAPIFWHPASQIFVAINLSEGNLQDLINIRHTSGGGLCANIPSVYSSNIDPGHNASHISVSIGGTTKTLQDAINDGDFCCTLTTCSALGYNCGTWSNGCGGTLNCGTCSTGYTCSSGHCVCTPETNTQFCTRYGYSCGTLTRTDNCGITRTVNCGTCSTGYTCSSGQCVCSPTTCSALGYNCGTWSNGCGGTLNCGSCSVGYTCSNGHCTAVTATKTVTIGAESPIFNCVTYTEASVYISGTTIWTRARDLSQTSTVLCDSGWVTGRTASCTISASSTCPEFHSAMLNPAGTALSVGNVGAQSEDIPQNTWGCVTGTTCVSSSGSCIGKVGRSGQNCNTVCSSSSPFNLCSSANGAYCTTAMPGYPQCICCRS